MPARKDGTVGTAPDLVGAGRGLFEQESSQALALARVPGVALGPVLSGRVAFA